MKKAKCGVVCDIDGVLLRGSTVLPGAAESLRKLQDQNLPFVFVTNGGGKLEADKAAELTEKLGLTIQPDQIVLSHTPFQDYVAQYGDKNVLVIGNSKCCDVARTYGFTRPISPVVVCSKWPTSYQLPIETAQVSSKSVEFLDESPMIDAAFVFSDSVNWGLDIQILTDVLLGQYEDPTTAAAEAEEVPQRIPLFVCNMDLTYATEYPYHRFTQGAFVNAFEHVFEKYAGFKPEVTYCGKPYSIQFEYAARVADAEAKRIGCIDATQSLSKFFMIGDNPTSDIRGSRNAGPNWTSILVRTGVFKGENDAADPADIVVESIREAVDYIVCSNASTN
jgi:HAD superfamily hydrolase (TIGR01456 family)